ncbi:MAG: A/G-specific adenine glycosylase [Hydrogenibacillus schlegelii]|uniref:Adenine DNA glycosylase n=1 Tax=Hydrogenibacillus schlegelii TaxID=1484 RepID=A0A2T5G4T1_HYDSH|nr:hypothetical protein [Hydrogenibacillus schlegelii]PTQ51173.1 MAG: A/G-specific adenine glycosylase [Hydrogenibacillus schlegelii]
MNFKGAPDPPETIVPYLREALLKWGRENLRDFPWRRTRDPYRVLLSEMLLQRTRAAQAVPVYEELIRRYPSVFELSRAEPDGLERILAPLGLRWRIPLIREMAGQVVERHGGRIPADRKQLLSLPGVGDYAASAVLSFAFNFPEPVLDANTVRLTGRLFGIEVTESSRRSRGLRELVAGLVDREHPRLFNYAFLDVASTICRPGKPVCGACPVAEICYHYAEAKKRDSGREAAGD